MRIYKIRSNGSLTCGRFDTIELLIHGIKVA
jgi:hypothetical protein